jgi:hypothetical protein
VAPRARRPVLGIFMTITTRLAALAATISIFALLGAFGSLGIPAASADDETSQPTSESSSQQSSPSYQSSSSSSYQPSSSSSYQPSSSSSYQPSSSSSYQPSSSNSQEPTSWVPPFDDSSSASVEPPRGEKTRSLSKGGEALNSGIGLDRPNYLHCQPGGTVTVYPNASGMIVNARQPGTSGYFRVGHFAKGKFVSENRIGWTAKLQDGQITIADKTGTAVAHCDN